MNISGYELFFADRLEDAATVFNLNVEAFSNSWKVYDSYGEVLLALGQKAEGIENYKKSVELNPDNRHAVEILKEAENQ